MKWFKDLKRRLDALLEVYGKVALWTYLSIFGASMVGFYAAISMGVELDSTAGTTGAVGAAWLATKATQPLRILATLALTPVVARIVRRSSAGEEPTPPPEVPSSPA